MKMFIALLTLVSSTAFAADFHTGSFQCVSKKTSEITRTISIRSVMVGGLELPVVVYKRGMINVKGLASIARVTNDAGQPAIILNLPIGRTTHAVYLREDGSIEEGEQEICSKI